MNKTYKRQYRRPALFLPISTCQPTYLPTYLTYYVFTQRSCLHLAKPPSYRTTPWRMSATVLQHNRSYAAYLYAVFVRNLRTRRAVVTGTYHDISVNNSACDKWFVIQITINVKDNVKMCSSAGSKHSHHAAIYRSSGILMPAVTQTVYLYPYEVHCREGSIVYSRLYGAYYTGLFISPSGISELDCATTKTDTAERSISTGRESLQVFFLY